MRHVAPALLIALVSACTPTPDSPPSAEPARGVETPPTAEAPESTPNVALAHPDAFAFVAGSPQAALFAAINNARARQGLGSLRADPRLAAAARAHAAAMAADDFFDHRGPDGAGLAARVVRAGYAYSRIAENLAAGHDRATDVVATWLLSEGHRRNLLDAEARDAGVGYVDSPADPGRVRYHRYWVAIFGRGPR